MKAEHEKMLRAYAGNAVDRTEMEQAISALLEERDELLEALRRAEHYMQNVGANMTRDYPEIGEALARAEGGEKADG